MRTDPSGNGSVTMQNTLHIPVIPDGATVEKAALLYADAGWYVGPYDADRAKNPGGLLGVGWHKQTSRDHAVIARWWAAYPNAAVFLHMGRSGAVAFDVDHPDKLDPGTELGQALTGGAAPIQLTRDERHGSRGYYRGHYLFAQPPGRDIGNSRGLTGNNWGEVRGRNGVIVVAPSLHVHHGHGGIYRWLVTGPVPMMPTALAAQLRDASPEIDAASRARLARVRGQVVGSTDPGLLDRGPVRVWNELVTSGQSRHDALTSALPFAYREALAGLYPLAWAEDGLRAMFVDAVQRPDLGSGSVRSVGEAHREFDAVAAWALGQAQAADPARVRADALGRTTVTLFDGVTDPFLVPSSSPAGPPVPLTGSLVQQRHLSLTAASQIPMRAQRWLWWDTDLNAKWMPLGGIVLLGGREGLGKSTLATKIAAAVTRGTLPGNFSGHPRSVIVSAGEDAWEQTIVPRFVAAGADMSRVFRVDVHTTDGQAQPLELPVDNQALQQACLLNDVALIVLDPLMTIVGGKLDTHKDADVRRALGPLRDMAEAAQVTVLGLIHVSKSKDEDLLTRMMASRAFTAVARAVLFCARQVPEEPQDDAEDDFGTPAEEETFLFGQLKSNLGVKVRHTIQYRIETVVVGHDREIGMDIETSRIVDIGRRDERINEIVASQEGTGKKRAAPKRAAAGEWLVSLLRDNGPQTWLEVLAAADKQYGKMTLYAAKDDKGIVDVLRGDVSAWSLPTPYVVQQ